MKLKFLFTYFILLATLSFSIHAQDAKAPAEENKEAATSNAATDNNPAQNTKSDNEAPKAEAPAPVVNPEPVKAPVAEAPAPDTSQANQSSDEGGRLSRINFKVLGLGIVLLGLGVFIIVDYYKKMPTEEQMDQWINEDLTATKLKSLKKTGIDSSELVHDQIVIVGPRLEDQAGADWHIKKGKDNVLRYTPINVTILNMTANQLIAYNCCLDITTGNQLNESTDEYFYKDVVSVSTKTSSFTMKFSKPTTVGGVTLDQMQFNSGEKFILSTSGGTSIEVFLKDDQWQRDLGGEIWTLDVEKAVQAVRKMLREKKA
jgi:hypothetical protein